MEKFKKRYLVSPVSPLCQKIYAFLEKVDSISNGQRISKKSLIERIKKEGYTEYGIKSALWELEDVINIGSVWDRDEKDVYFIFHRIEEGEKAFLVADLGWFDDEL